MSKALRVFGVKAILILLVGGLIATLVVGTAAVRFAMRDGTQTAFWPSHPEMVLHRTMETIAVRSVRKEALPPSLLSDVERVQRESPLAPEPFLIKGALAQLEGRGDLAERFYLQARARDPRSRPARYFLADYYLRTGRMAPALSEMAVFSTLTNGNGALAPALAAYAQTPGAVAQLRALFREAPDVEGPVLSDLAADPQNRQLILDLWTSQSSVDRATSLPWQERLITALIAKGAFNEAFRTWSFCAGVRAVPGQLFNPQFQRSSAPPPFNWRYATTGGVAEPGGNGQLKVINFAREDVVLAEQLLTLSPGSYTLGMNVQGETEGALAWSVECMPQPLTILQLPFKRPGRLSGKFVVPAANCAAQRLKLNGIAGDFARSTQATIGGLDLRKEPAA